ncbi:MFS transporter [Catellatospora aurea]|uniref:MFS transporter n=1 Tax=Catellatospora aurea TaxID=1337874 RepID=A0ABW2H6L8_9ACTN
MAAPYARISSGFLVSQVFFGLATSLFDMYYALHLQQVGIGPAGVGQIFSVGFIVMAVVVLPLSAVTDRFGLEPSMVVSSVGFGLTMLVMPLSDRFAAQLLLFAVNSVAAAMMLVSVNAVVGASVPDEQRRLSLFRHGFVAFLAASAAGNLLGVGLAALGGSGDYRSELLLSGALALLIGVARAMMWQRGAVRSAPAGGTLSALRDAVREHGARLGELLLLAGLVGGAGVLAIRFVPLLVVNHLGLDEQWLGWVLVADRVASVVGIFVLFPLMRRGGVFRVAGWGMCAALLFQGLGAAATGAALFLLWYLLRQGSHYAQMPVLDHTANLLAPTGVRAFVNGVQRMGIFVGSAVASLAYGTLMDQGAYRTAIVLSGVLSFLAGLLYLRRARAQRRVPVAVGEPVAR